MCTIAVLRRIYDVFYSFVDGYSRSPWTQQKIYLTCQICIVNETHVLLVYKPCALFSQAAGCARGDEHNRLSRAEIRQISFGIHTSRHPFQELLFLGMYDS